MDKTATFRQWVNEYADPLYRYACMRLTDNEACKDLVQETFLSAWRNLDAYKGEASSKNWLFIILKNKITDHFRKAATQSVSVLLQEYDDETFFDSTGHWRQGMYPREWTVDFADPMESKQFYQVFNSCGKKLREVQNAVFIMKYVDGLDSDEICKALNLSADNYWVLMHRAKVQLRACLQKNWIDK
jgi:RNA polymerase sigma-70 factor (TIGR02943 family)